MRFTRKLIILIVVLVSFTNSFCFGPLLVFAHNELLDISYDDCVGNKEGDGIDEMWYVLTNQNSSCYHLGEEEVAIRYYFAESSSSEYTWTTDVSDDEAEIIKDAIANSMKKWNQVAGIYSWSLAQPTRLKTR